MCQGKNFPYLGQCDVLMTGGDKEILAGMTGEKTLYKLSEMRNGMEAANSGAVYNTTVPEFLEFSCRCSRLNVIKPPLNHTTIITHSYFLHSKSHLPSNPKEFRFPDKEFLEAVSNTDSLLP